MTPQPTEIRIEIAVAAGISAVLFSLVWTSARAEGQSAPEIGYEAAKGLADSSEAKLPPALQAVLLQEQARALGSALAACSHINRGVGNTTIVLELKSDGSVAHAWRNSDAEIAMCLQRHLKAARIIGAWPTPFYTSFELAIHL